jgi:hypothetical protein
MKKKTILMLTAVLVMAVAVPGVNGQKAVEKKTTPAAAKKPAPPTGPHKGKVLATTNTSGYTYIQFEEKGKKYWAAAREIKVAVGDTIEFKRSMLVSDFKSKTLNRTFDFIFFVSTVQVNGEFPNRSNSRQLPKGHGPIDKKMIEKKMIKVEPGSIKKAEGGYTVAECHAGKGTLDGKVIKIRGRVIKFSQGILRRNWIHLKDGTGDYEKATNDLTITTQQMVEKGDLILVTGKIAYDKNYGAGYAYKVIVEDAAIVVEK